MVEEFIFAEPTPPAGLLEHRRIWHDNIRMFRSHAGRNGESNYTVLASRHSLSWVATQTIARNSCILQKLVDKCSEAVVYCCLDDIMCEEPI